MKSTKYGKIITTQARTEIGLNPGGYLACKYTFKVRREGGLTDFSTDASPPSVLQVPTCIFDAQSNIDDGGNEDGDENGDEDHDVADDEE